MSRFNLLSDREADTARSQGWMLCEVFDLGKKRWNRQILPLQFCKTTPHAAHMTTVVINRARDGDSLALHALQLIAQGHRT